MRMVCWSRAIGMEMCRLSLWPCSCLKCSGACWYSIELQLGESSNFILMIENVPLQIFKTGNNYLAVLGKARRIRPKRN